MRTGSPAKRIAGRTHNKQICLSDAIKRGASFTPILSTAKHSAENAKEAPAQIAQVHPFNNLSRLRLKPEITNLGGFRIDDC